MRWNSKGQERRPAVDGDPESEAAAAVSASGFPREAGPGWGRGARTLSSLGPTSLLGEKQGCCGARRGCKDSAEGGLVLGVWVMDALGIAKGYGQSPA